MLKALKWFVLGLLVMVVAGGWFAYTRHVVKMKDGYHVVRKRQPSFQNIYVDTTTWGPLDWLSNVEVRDAVALDGLDQAQREFERQTQEMKKALDKGMDDARKELETRGK